MTKAATFDWSALDRNLIAEMVNFTSYNVVDKSLSPTSFSNKLREILRFFKIPVKVRSCYNTKTEKNCVWVGGWSLVCKSMTFWKVVRTSLCRGPIHGNKQSRGSMPDLCGG